MSLCWASPSRIPCCFDARARFLHQRAHDSYWVATLAPESAEALTGDRIADFQHWNLLVMLPVSRVALIPLSSFAIIPAYVLRDTSLEWQEQLTEEQILAMSEEQQKELRVTLITIDWRD